MKITAIKQQQKLADRFSVFVDDKYAFSFTTNELLEQKLAVGDELDAGEVKKLKKLAIDGKIYHAALNY
ncbi:MAG: recombination regulator RecX, partial [Candidatus Saccharimonadales bacterium]